ncbi:hypothetical protein CCP3SC15_1550010 [Gammaproteobacteria bacterium]
MSLSQQEIADELKIKQTAWSYLEREAVRIDTNIVNLLVIRGASADYLLKGIGSPLSASSEAAFSDDREKGHIGADQDQPHPKTSLNDLRLLARVARDVAECKEKLNELLKTQSLKTRAREHRAGRTEDTQSGPGGSGAGTSGKQQGRQ